jgi:hypothetical protein
MRSSFAAGDFAGQPLSPHQARLRGARKHHPRGQALTDADESLRRLFVPAARANDASLEVEAREQTASGWVVSRGARVVSNLERMERHGHVTHRQGAAGRQLYRDYVLGVCGARDRDAAVSGSSPGGYADAQLDAVTRYRTVRDRLGPRLWVVVYSVVLDDVSVPDYCRARGLNPTSMTQVLRIALDMAGDTLGID